MFGAGDMASTSQLIMGAQRINMDTDMDGNVFMNRDSSENLKRGYNESIGYISVAEHLAGVTGSAILGATMAGSIGEGLYKTFGPEGNKGIAKPAFKKFANSLASFTGREKPFPETPDETINSSSNTGNNKETNGTENAHNNEVHKNSFESKSEGSVSKTDKSSKAYDVGGKATSVSEEIIYTIIWSIVCIPFGDDGKEKVYFLVIL